MECVMEFYTMALQALQFLILGYFISVFFQKRDFGKINSIYLFTLGMFFARVFFGQVLELWISDALYTPYMVWIMGVLLYVCYQMKLWEVLGMIMAYIGMCVIPTLLTAICTQYIPYMSAEILNDWGTSPEVVIVISIMEMIINLVYVAVLVIYYMLKKSLRLPGRLLFFLVFLYQILIFAIYLERCMIYRPVLVVTGMFMVVLTTFLDIMLIAEMRTLLEHGQIEAFISKIYEQRACELQYYHFLDEQRRQLQEVHRDFSKKLEEMYRVAGQKETAGRLMGLMNETNEKLCQYRVKQYCRNQIINSVIYVKKKKADQAGIHMDVNLELPEQIGVETVDLCSIFCNLLDNAMEACEKVLHGRERYIKLSAGIRAGYLLITEKNTMEGGLRRKNGRILTSKQDERQHGYGLDLIRFLSEKYAGEVEVKEKEGEFLILVVVKPDTLGL